MTQDKENPTPEETGPFSGRTTLIETTHHGEYYNVRQAEVPSISIGAVYDFLDNSPYNKASYTHNVELLVRDLTLTGRGHIGWARYRTADADLFNKSGFNRYGLDADGYAADGFTPFGFDAKGNHRDTGVYLDPSGFTRWGSRPGSGALPHSTATFNAEGFLVSI